MFGFGTIINTIAIIFAGICGLLFGKRLSPRFQDNLMMGSGVCVLFLGIGGALSQMLVQNTDGTFSTTGTMMLIASIAIGGILGELLNIDHGMERFGEWLKSKTGNEKDARFVDGFVTASLTVCIGAMAVVGSIQDGIYGDYSTLTAKAVLDFIIILIMTASIGKGCMFSAIPVFLFQGTITLLSRLIEPLLTPAALANLSLVGSVLIFCVGLNLVWGKKIRVANLLPALIVAVGYAFLPL